MMINHVYCPGYRHYGYPGGRGLVNLVKLPCPYKGTSEIYRVVSARMYSLLKSTYHPDTTEKVTDEKLSAHPVADSALQHKCLDLAAKHKIVELSEAILT
jgi:hypothetical protein